MTPKRAPQLQVNEDKNEIEVMMRELCTVRQAAEILGVRRKQIHVLIEEKKITAVQLDNWFWVVDRKSLDEYLKTKSSRGRPPSGKSQKTRT